MEGAEKDEIEDKAALEEMKAELVRLKEQIKEQGGKNTDLNQSLADLKGQYEILTQSV